MFDLVAPKAVQIAASKDMTITRLCKTLAQLYKHAYAPHDADISVRAANALKERCAQSPISLDGGVLLLLGHLPERTRPTAVFIRFRQPTLVKGLAAPADLVYAQFGPKDERRTDLMLLAQAAQILVQSRMQNSLRETTTPSMLHSVLTDAAAG